MSTLTTTPLLLAFLIYCGAAARELNSLSTREIFMSSVCVSYYHTGDNSTLLFLFASSFLCSSSSTSTQSYNILSERKILAGRARSSISIILFGPFLAKGAVQPTHHNTTHFLSIQGKPWSTAILSFDPRSDISGISPAAWEIQCTKNTFPSGGSYAQTLLTIIV